MKYIFLILIAGIVGCKNEPNYDKIIDEEIKANVGRYQLIQLGTFRRDQYLLDTATGKVWENVCGVPEKGGDCAFAYWAEDTVEGITMSSEGILEAVNIMKKSK